jgi:hypothetical protein
MHSILRENLGLSELLAGANPQVGKYHGGLKVRCGCQFHHASEVTPDGIRTHNLSLANGLAGALGESKLCPGVGVFTSHPWTILQKFIQDSTPRLAEVLL